MSLVLVNGTGFQLGVETDEVALNIDTFSCRYFAEFQKHLPNKHGQTRTSGYPDKWSREINLAGEVSGTTGLLAATLVPSSAFVPANDVALYTAVGGGFYDLGITEGQSREGWRRLDASATSHPERT